MTMNAKTVLVTGATGQQGGAVAWHLLKQPGFLVRGLTRDTTKPTARALAQQGAELIRGDLDNMGAIEQALRGVHGVFSVQSFMQIDKEREIRQGKALAEAAKAAEVRHFVYSSVVSADRKTGLSHFESKWQIEQQIRQVGLPFTILRPAFFMQNWRNYFGEQILQGTLPLPLDPEKPLQQVSVEDIGAIAALAFRNPDKWMGRTVELAGDEHTMLRVAEILSRVVGQAVKNVQMPWEQFRQIAGEEMTRMYQWFNDVGYHIDIATLRKEYAALSPLEKALRQQDWSAAQLAGRKAA